ncbi:MAG: hypothetical protein JNK82_21025, partial [Myxococcaceae bacterium]|nr:hypothetical protein [Myxococcaceae bacterium]
KPKTGKTGAHAAVKPKTGKTGAHAAVKPKTGKTGANAALNAKPIHPGNIVFVDEQGETVEPAAEVPESIRFAKNKDGRLEPVVRVVATTIGDQRTIREYGEEGNLLRSTVQFRH